MTAMSVTQIIGEIYPFNDQSKLLWIQGINAELASLGRSPVGYDSLLRATQIIGDIIHTHFIELAMGFPSADLPEKFALYEKPIRDCIERYKIEGLLCEFTIQKPNEYVGHPDLLVLKEWKGERVKALCDIKTYGLYRQILGLPAKGDAKKLNGQTAKVSLQTSMYRDALVFSEDEHVKIHWNVSRLFCYHILPDEVNVVELEYSIKKYLEWKEQIKSIL